MAIKAPLQNPSRRHGLRQLIAGLGGFGGLGGLGDLVGSLARAAPAPSPQRYLAARQRAGRFEVALIDGTSGRDLRVFPLPGRGHSFALDPRHGRAVVFARQAGFFAAALDLNGTTPPCIVVPAPDRHFFGHGVYVNDGRQLVATENDYENGRGVLGLYDVSPGGDYHRIGEFDTGGVGPHEVIAMPDGHTLCVANGGILTHPDYGKLALNLDSMAPSLAYVDVRSGNLLERIALPPELHRLSIRHLSLDGTGVVWFGCQYMGTATDRPPLVGRHRRGAEIELYTGPDDVLHRLQNYIGSVSVSACGSIVATSSPVGGLVAYWDAASGRCLGVTDLPDGCGIAPTPDGGFLFSSGHGALVHVGPDSAPRVLRQPAPGLSWDNHCRLLAIL